MNKPQPPSNAKEIQPVRLKYACDSCHVHTGTIHAFRNENPPKLSIRVTNAQINRPDIRVCTGCFFAYRHTMQAHGWKFEGTRKWYNAMEVKFEDFEL